MTTIHDLSDEILERILHYVLQPGSITEHGEWHKFSPDFQERPEDLLRARLRSCRINKKLFAMALPAYFRMTQLSMVIGDAKDYDKIFIGSKDSWTPRARLLFGTFTETSIFFDNTRKLRVEMEKGDNGMLAKLYKVLIRCKKLVKVKVCLENLSARHGEELMGTVRRTVQALINNGIARHITVVAESEVEYERQVEMRDEARVAYKKYGQLVAGDWQRLNQARHGPTAPKKRKLSRRQQRARVRVQAGSRVDEIA